MTQQNPLAAGVTDDTRNAFYHSNNPGRGLGGKSPAPPMSVHAVVCCLLGMGGLARGATPADANTSAESDSEPTLSEIVVTATRTATSAQDIPLAISAISGDALRQLNISDPSQLSSLAPNLYVDQGEANGMTHVSIRGLASTDFSVGASSPVATYIDDIYQAFQFGTATQIYDLNRVEVLRGPQGTLFGKNATGGALTYYSQTPTRETQGYMKITGGGGDFGHFSAEGAYNTPLSDTLAARVSILVDRRDNYIENLYNDTKLGHYTNFNGRLQFAWTPSDELTVNLKLFGVSSWGDGPVYLGQWLGGECVGAYAVYNKCVDGVPAPDSPNTRTTYSDVPISEGYDEYGATLKNDYKMGTSTLTAITGWQKGAYSLRTNDTGTEGDLFHSLQASVTQQISQEVRVATDASQPIHAVGGVFGQYDTITANQGSASTTTDPTLGYDYYQGGVATQYTTTLAGFGSVTGDVTQWLSLVGGARYSYERKHIVNVVADLEGFNATTFATRDFTNADLSYPTIINQFPPDPNYGDAIEYDRATASWKKATWDATANFKPTDQGLIYGKVARGFRSGGFPVGTTAPGLFVELKPEIVTSYEIGFKSEWLQHTLRVNGAIFDMEYKDMQVQTPNITGPGLVLSNAGSSRVRGAELEVEYVPVRSLHLNASAGYSDARYLNYLSSEGQLAGNRLPYAPEVTANIGGNYEIQVAQNRSLTLGTVWKYRSEIFFDPYNTPGVTDPSHVTGDLSIGYGTVDKGWRVAAIANNVTNQTIKVFSYTLGFVDPSIYGPRRTWGITLDYAF